MVKPVGIQKVKDLAEDKGFICLDNEYKNNSTSMNFRCKKNNHSFVKSYAKLRKAKYCPICIGHYKQSPDTIIDLQNYAKEMGGECLTRKYNYSDNYYLWRCDKNHEWKAKWNAVKNNKSWCSVCAGNKKHTTEHIKHELQKIGYNVSNDFKYKNGRTKIKLVCNNGHDFSMNWNSISQGRSCPDCNSFTGEIMCRLLFNGMLQGNFHKVKPRWLRNKAGNLLELDGYDSKLKIAFEYHGQQHRKHNRLFHSRESSSLIKQKKHDKIKIKKCKEKGIKLIIIHGYSKINESSMKTQIINRLNKFNINIINEKFSITDKKQLYNANYNNDLSKYEIEYNFKKIDETIILNSTTKFNVICLIENCGHKWSTNLRNLKTGRSCRKCTGFLKKSTEEIQNIVKNYDLKFHDSNYINQDTIHRWKCKCGNIFSKKFINLKRVLDRNSGNGCDNCNTHWNKRDLNYFIDRITNKGYVYLSGNFNGINKSKFKIKCDKHGIKEITPRYIIYAGGICSQCKSEGNKYTEEFLISEIKRYQNKYGKKPSLKNFNFDKDFPSSSPYQKLYGKNFWSKALKKANII